MNISKFCPIIVFAVFGLTYSSLQAEEIARSSRPNVLICMADDASYPHMGANGCTWVQTPGFDRVAREGLRFTHAYTLNAKCSPSRACFLTGRNPWQLEEACNHIPYFPPKFATFPEALKVGGYFVGFTQKGWAPGVAHDVDGKPRQMTGQPFNARKTTSPTKGISNNDYAGNFRDFLDVCPDDRPWCFWYGSVEPHRGYTYGTGVSLGKKSPDDIDRVPEYWPDNAIVRNDMLDYAFELEYFDSHLCRMLEELENRGELDNTIVIVTADNGMPFPRAKGQSYEISCHLPLAILWPREIQKPGRVIDDYVSFIDIAPTIIELAQIVPDQNIMQPMTGKSLFSIFHSEKDGLVEPNRDFVLLGRERNDVGRPNDEGYPIRSLVKNDMLYLYNFEPDRWPAANPETGYLDVDGGPTKTEVLQARKNRALKRFWQMSFGKRGNEELYDLRKDPDCVHNLMGDADYAESAGQLKSQLFSMLTEQQDPRVLEQGHVFDDYLHATEATRHFYERFTNGEPLEAGWVNPTDFETEKINADGDTY